MPARDLGLPIHAGARVYVLPCIAGHVGADAAGVILSEAPYLTDEVKLLVDVGTNAEIVLGNRYRLLAASSPTGPAFEGAQISCGHRAAPGAIERVRIDPDTLEPRFRVIGADAWSDEPGFAGGARRHRRVRVRDHRGDRRAAPRRRPHDGRNARRRARRRTLVEVVADGARSRTSCARRAELVVTQNDVREIQLAKAALHAGVRAADGALGVEERRPDPACRAFGSHIDPVHALVLGLVPDCDPSGVTSAGNAAGTGRASRCWTAPRETRSRTSSARREDRDRRSSRGSRSTSSTRWRSRTTSIRTHGSPRTVDAARTEDHRAAASGPQHGADRARGGSHDRDQTAAAPAGAQHGRQRGTHAVVEPVPFLTRTLTPVEVLSEEGLSLIEENADTILEKVGIELPRRPRRTRVLRRRGRRGRRRARPLPAWPRPPARAGDRPARIHAGRAQPRAQRRVRRPEHDLRPRLRVAVRPRPRRRSTLRDDRGLPQLREARVLVALDPPFGRDGV